MPSVVTLRLIVRDPVPGISLAVQRGKGELVTPTTATKHAVTFDIALEVKAGSGGTNVLKGPEIQGPPAGRFIYINAGTYAGQHGTEYGRRAKVPLGALGSALIERALKQPGAVIALEIEGRARDGGPAAATQQVVASDWHIVDRSR